MVRLLLAVFSWAGHGSSLGCSFLIRKTRAVLVQCFVTRAVCEDPLQIICININHNTSIV